jgi:hypothetical protein
MKGIPILEEKTCFKDILFTPIISSVFRNSITLTMTKPRTDKVAMSQKVTRPCGALCGPTVTQEEPAFSHGFSIRSVNIPLVGDEHRAGG